MKIFLLAFATLFFFSCKTPKKLNLADVLKSNCFWDRTDESGVVGGLNSCYRFLPTGECFFYYYNFYNGKKTDSVYRFEDTDVIVPKSWSVQEDTLILAQGSAYRVLDFTKDSIVVEAFDSDTMVFRKNCNTILKR